MKNGVSRSLENGSYLEIGVAQQEIRTSLAPMSATIFRNHQVNH
jgi:hypothetical protein